MIRTGVQNGEKHWSGAAGLPFPEQSTQVLSLWLAGPRGRGDGDFQRIVAVAEQDPVSFKRRRCPGRPSPRQDAAVVVLQEPFNFPRGHQILPRAWSTH